MRWPWREVGSPWALGLLRAVVALVAWAESYASWRIPHHVDAPLVMVLGVALTLSSTAMLVGWHGRLASGATGVGMLLLHLAGARWGLSGGGLAFAQTSTFEIALSCVLLALGPCSDRVSVDALRHAASARAPLWSHALLRVHASITLGAVALSHIDGMWLSGERLARMLTARRSLLVEAGPAEAGLSMAWLALEVLAVLAPWLPCRPGFAGRSWAVWLAAGFLLLQYPWLYTGTWSVHMAALVVLSARTAAAREG